MNVTYLNCRLIKEDESDLRSSEHYLSGNENKAWKKKIQACTGVEPLTSEIPVQCSTNWATSPPDYIIQEGVVMIQPFKQKNVFITSA